MIQANAGTCRGWFCRHIHISSSHEAITNPHPRFLKASLLVHDEFLGDHGVDKASEILEN